MSTNPLAEIQETLVKLQTEIKALERHGELLPQSGELTEAHIELERKVNSTTAKFKEAGERLIQIIEQHLPSR